MKSAAVLLGGLVLGWSWAGGPAPAQPLVKGKFQNSKSFELGNFARVDVEAGEGEFVHQRGIRLIATPGNQFIEVPFDVITVTTPSGQFRISDLDMGNGEVLINGTRHKFGLKQHLLINARGEIKLVAGGSRNLLLPIEEKKK